MNLEYIIYYRYLYRHSILYFVIYLFSLIIAAIIIFFVINERQIWSYLILIVFGFFTLINLAITLFWFFKYQSLYKKYSNKKLVQRIKHYNIRKKVLHSGIRLKFFVSNRKQEQLFLQAVESEISKQKQLLNLSQKIENQ